MEEVTKKKKRKQDKSREETGETSRKKNKTKKQKERTFDLADARTAQSRDNSKGETAKKGGLSIINAKMGCRITLSSKMFRKLDNPDKVQVLFKEEELIIGNGLPGGNENYSVRKDGKEKIKGQIYNSHLVKEITAEYKLDFSNRTSITFGEVKYYNQDGAPFAVIQMFEE